MITLHYKGFTANVEYSDEAQCWVGRIECNGDVITFESHSLGEIETDFRRAVDDDLKSVFDGEVYDDDDEP